MKNNIILALILSLFSLFLGACGGKSTPVDIGNEKQILHKGNGAEPEDLDPQTVMGLPEANILLALFEGLVSMDPVDMSPVPGVAKNWDISRDGKEYTFHLREDAKWSNGDPVTANDFIFSYKRTLSRKLGSPFADLFFAVEGARGYYEGDIEDFNEVGFQALNDYTLRIKLKNPQSYFLSKIMHFAWFPVHSPTILKHGAIDQRGSSWTRAGNMVSNGPFKLKKWDVSEVVSVERNPHYWDNETTKLNEINFYPMDVNTEERAFRAKQLHMTYALALPKVKTYRESNSPYLSITPFYSNYGFVFNTDKAPFDSAKVREAFSLALDRQSLVDSVTQGGQDPAFSFVPPGTSGYRSTTQLHEDINEARRLLSEAGYPNGVGFPKIELVYNTSDNHKSVAEALQHMWKKNLGVDVELVNLEWKVYLRMRKGDDYNLLRFGWVGDYIDPNAFLTVFKSYSNNNYAKWKNSEYDELLDNAALAQTKQERFDYYNRAESLLLRELPIVPIYFYTTVNLIRPSVRNWSPNLIDLRSYKYVYLEKE